MRIALPVASFPILKFLSAAQKDRLILLLARQVAILERSRRKSRIKLEIKDKDRYVIARLVSSIGPIARDFVIIIKPATLKNWMHNFATYIHYLKSAWGKLKKKILCLLRMTDKTGRPRITKAIRNLIIRLKSENLHWGVRRIRDELWNSNLRISSSSIRRILRRHFPFQKKVRSQYTNLADYQLTWDQVWFALREGIHAMDLFSVFSLLGRQIFCFVIVNHANRACIHFASTTNPNPVWIWCELKRAYSNHALPEKLICDNDCNFDYSIKMNLKSKLGVKLHRTGVQSPWENAVVERLIRTVRSECFDRIPPVFGCAHAERLMTHFVNYYNNFRPHSTIGYESPLGRPCVQKDLSMPCIKLKKVSLGNGLWNYYKPAG